MSTPMRHIRWLLAWAFFWLGHAVSRLDRFDIGWLIALWMPIYQWSMNCSSALQGPGDYGPWGAEIK